MPTLTEINLLERCYGQWQIARALLKEVDMENFFPPPVEIIAETPTHTITLSKTETVDEYERRFLVGYPAEGLADQRIPFQPVLYKADNPRPRTKLVSGLMKVAKILDLEGHKEASEIAKSKAQEIHDAAF